MNEFLKEHEEFLEELQHLKAKYEIYSIVALNFDDETIGYIQMSRIQEINGKKCLILAFSGKGEKICQCCSKKE